MPANAPRRSAAIPKLQNGAAAFKRRPRGLRAFPAMRGGTAIRRRVRRRGEPSRDGAFFEIASCLLRGLCL